MEDIEKAKPKVNIKVVLGAIGLVVFGAGLGVLGTYKLAAEPKINSQAVEIDDLKDDLKKANRSVEKIDGASKPDPQAVSDSYNKLQSFCTGGGGSVSTYFRNADGEFATCGLGQGGMRTAKLIDGKWVTIVEGQQVGPAGMKALADNKVPTALVGGGGSYERLHVFCQPGVTEMYVRTDKGEFGRCGMGQGGKKIAHIRGNEWVELTGGQQLSESAKQTLKSNNVPSALVKTDCDTTNY